MEHCQLNAFTPRTKALVGAILAFEKLLLENSTNRKIYASFDRLNDLLHTSDLSILLATLCLALRPAQQFSSSSQNGVVVFGISEKRLLNLAQGWGTRDYGLEMVDLVAETVELPPELDDLEWQFYKKLPAGSPGVKQPPGEPGTDKKAKGKEVDNMEVEDVAIESEAGPSTLPAQAAPTATPTRPSTAFPGFNATTPAPSTPSAVATASSAPTEGLTTVVLTNIRTSPKSPIDLLVDAVETYGVPESERLALLQKIRISKALPSAEARRTMLVVRLLAIAVFAHTVSENSVQTKIFLYEPELIPQLAELVHPDRNVPIEIQAAAFYALDALAKFKGKTSEVASALNASVSHGILMYVLRRTVTDLAGDSPVSTPDFIDSLFNILSFFQTNSHVGNMIVGAGVTSILVDFVKNQRRDRVAVVTKAITFLDSLMYGYSSAFNLFISVGGLGVFVQRVKDEVELSIAAHGSFAAESQDQSDAPTGLLSFEQAALLKALLRAIQRLMQTAGTTEGLRNLIDTSLLASVKAIISSRGIFGPQLFGLSINIVATFVHNEPMCLTTIQEAKVPEALYDAVEESIPPSIDVLQAIPNAIGALCLNTAGLAQFNTRTIIPKYFAIFASEKHARILQERDNATMIGACIDELIRHHPSLKDQVLAAVIDSLKAIRENAKAFVPESSDGYSLQIVVSPAEDVAMEAIEPAAAVPSVESAVPTPDVATPDSTGTPKPEEIKDNPVMISLDVTSRFLEGLFQNVQHCKDFIRLEPFSIILDIFSLPCMPHSAVNSPTFSSVSTLFRVMSEVKPTEVVQAVLKQLKGSLAATKALWSPPSMESRLLPLLSPIAETLEMRNKDFRDLATLLSFIALLLDMCSSMVYSHGKVPTLVLTALAAPGESQTIADLGGVYRFCLWESVLLKKVTAITPPGTSPNTTTADSPPVVDEPSVREAPSSSTVSPSLSSPRLSTSAKAVQDLVAALPQNIAPLLQAATKMFVHRRSGEAAHRKASAEVATSIAALMKESLRWPDSPSLTDNLAYSTLMINLITGLLYDDRSTSSGIQTMLLVAFEKAEGLRLFLELYTRYQDIASDIVAKPDDSAKAEASLPAVHAFGGLKMALDLLLRLSSHRTLLEAPQTALLLQREKDRTNPDFFEPHEFLISLRAAILPAVTSTWDVPWLRKSPPSVVRSIVGTIINVLRAEGESASDTSTTTTSNTPFAPFTLAGFGGAALNALGSGAPPAAVADETRVTQLVEMGFPRSAARIALVRCRNSVPVATEYLLQHPDIVGAARTTEEEDAVAEAEVEVEPVAAAPIVQEAALVPAVEAGLSSDAADASPEARATPDVQEGGLPESDVEMGDGERGEAAALNTTVTTAESPRAAAVKEAKAALDAAREALKLGFLPKALSLAEDYPELVFDIKGAFGLLYPTSGDGAPSLAPLLEDLAKVEAGEATEQAIATRLRVIALLGADAAYRETIETSREEVMAVLMRYQKAYFALSPTKDSRPKWLPPAMLVADTLFALTEVPRAAAILSESEEPELVELVEQGPKWDTERGAFFDLAMDVLAKGSSERDSFISCLRLFLVLTRQHHYAVKFVELEGLRVLFSTLAVERPETDGCHPFAVMLLRHIVEDATTLQPMMVREIEAWFSQPRAKVADVSGFLRGASSVAFRNVPLFLEATRSTCMLVRADSPGHYHVALKNPAGTKPVDADSTIRSPFAVDGTAVAALTDMAVDDAGGVKPAKTASIPAPLASLSGDASIHFLMTEALERSKALLAGTDSGSPEALKSLEISQAPASMAAQPAAESNVLPTAEAAPEVPPAATTDPKAGEFLQLSFALSCLAELLSSYASCKTSFLAFSTRRSPKEPSKEPTALKSRSSFLYFLLNDLIPVGTVVPPTDPDAKRRSTLSMWATLVVVSLCSDPDAAVARDPAAEMTMVRKGVLDAIARAFKEAAASTEPTDTRYGRLYALSDLCYRLLTSRPYPAVSKPNDETSMQLAKLMLEKNFAVILTNALADVDLNFPSVNNLINSILRPLEQLTKVVTKVGRSKSSAAAPPAGREGLVSTSESSFSEEELDVESEEEETPDLYRNSALGMYEGELEPGHQDEYMSGDSAEEYDEDDELMDEIDDGLTPGSDISDVSDDEEPAFISGDDIADMDSDDGEPESDDEHTDDSSTDGSEGDELEVTAEMGADELAADLLEGLAEGLGDDEGSEAEEEGWEDVDGERDGEDLGPPGDGFDSNHPLRDEDDPDTDGESFTDEEMYLTGELEFDPEMTEQLNASRGQQHAPFGWDSLGAGEGLAGRRSRLLDDMMMGGDATFFGGRVRGPLAPPTPVHPLLVDTPAGEQQVAASSSRRHRRGTGQNGPEYADWAQSIEQMMGTGAVEALQELLGSYGLQNVATNDQLGIHIGPGPDGGLALVIGTGAQNGAGVAPGGRRATAPPPPRPSRTAADRLSTSQFLPVMTVQRWQEEGRIEQGSVLVAERVARLTNHVINVLHPAARAAAKVAEAERQAKAAAKREADEARAAEVSKQEEQARMEEGARDAEINAPSVEASMEEVEPGSPASPSAPGVSRQTGRDGAEEDVSMHDDVAEVVRLANLLASGLAAPVPPPPPAAGSEAEPEASEEEPAEASASAATERVMITIDGQDVDITDTGIDPTFLEALPDDMRQEVLNQHFRESRSSGPPPAVPSQINSEFLDALPPDLRAEVLRQEAAELRREQAAARAAARSSGAALVEEPAGPVDIDPATFFATLDPELREAVLLEQEDGLLSTLPAHLAAEANALREHSGRRRAPRHAANAPTPSAAAAATSAGAATVAKKAPAHREAIQLLDKSGLATLVRLLFFPQPLRKNTLQKVLVNLCENSRTRTELINLLLTILQDGTRDVSAVDKSFSQMSLRASKSLAAKDTPRRKVGLETPGGGLPHFPGESVPNLIAQRCLEALMFLVTSNDQSPLFFLTEQEIVVGLGRRQSKKGKGKEKALPSTTFPVVILLGLLDRPALVKTQSMMDSLTQLLSAITKSLAVLQKKSTDDESTPPAASATDAAVAGLPSDITAAPGPPALPPTDSSTAANVPIGSGEPAGATEPKDGASKDVITADVLIKNPPQIAPAVLRLVVNVLDAGECSSKTFQQTLVLIQNLSLLPGARDVILEELKTRAQSLSEQLLPDLDELFLAVDSAQDVRSVTLAKFSPASSLQAKFLRILKTIDHSPPKKQSPDATAVGGGKQLSEEEEKVRTIYDSFAFGKLWDGLGRCLTAVEEKPELSYIGNVLLPLIEAVMVVSKFIGRRTPKDVHSPSPAPMSPSALRDADPLSIESVFLKFTDEHRRTINQLVRSNPGLMSGSFAVLAKNSSILDFDTKRNFFFSRLHDRSLRQRNHYGTLQVNVRRQHVFEDSFHVFQRRTGDEIKHGKLSVKFYDEEGVDAGGVTREWFSVLARQMFNPGYALFQPQAADALTYQPNKSSSINDHHLNYFKFVGRIIGKALHDQRVLEAYFSRAVYKHMLGKPVDHRDLESIDPEYHKSLVWMLENDIDGILDLTFSVERDEFGVSEIVDLIPDGRNVAVTNENKTEYVRLIADQRLSIEIKDQMHAMLSGLYEIVPKDLLQIFSEKELELLISGLPEIDVDEWRANTDLHIFTPTHPVIGYFWRAVRSFTMEERAKLLQFVSGSSRVPLEGFASLQGMTGVTKFSITSAGDTTALPTAHTCFNQLDLPTSYQSYEELRRALLVAITEGGEGFGFA